MLTLFLNKFKELNNLQKGQILAAFFVIILSLSTTTILVSNRRKPITYQPKASSDTPDSQCSLVFDVQDEPTQIITPTTIPSVAPTLIPTVTLIPTSVIPSPTPAFSCQQRCGTLVGRCGIPVSSTTIITCSVSTTYPGSITNDCASTCYCSLCSQPQKTPIPRPTLIID